MTTKVHIGQERTELSNGAWSHTFDNAEIESVVIDSYPEGEGYVTLKFRTAEVWRNDMNTAGPGYPIHHNIHYSREHL